MRYRKKPVVVDVVKFEGFNDETGQAIFSERPEWLTKEFGSRIIFFDKPNTLVIVTLEGNMTANIGDYIIKGVEGELYACKPSPFKKTYEKVEDQ